MEEVVAVRRETCDNNNDDKFADAESDEDTDGSSGDIDDGFHTQPIIPTDNNGDSTKGEFSTPQEGSATRARMVTNRHMTQPITLKEKKTIDPRASVGNSISQRLAALQKSGEQDWQKRIGKIPAPGQVGKIPAPAENTKAEAPSTPVGQSDVVVKLRNRQGLKAERPSSIADRLTLLEGAQEGWKERVEGSDASQFTVAGKLQQAGRGTPAAESAQQLAKRRRAVKSAMVRDSESSASTDSSSVPTSPVKSPLSPRSPLSPLLPRSPTMPKRNLPPKFYPLGRRSRPNSESMASSTPNINAANAPTTTSSDSTSSDLEKEKPERPASVIIPRADDEETFQSFFDSKPTQEVLKEKVEVSVDDFNHIFMESEDILLIQRKPRPTRRTQASRNPLRKLQERLDLREAYDDVKTDTEDRELRRMKRDEIAGKAGLAEEALAGLAAKENFAKISLRKAETSGSGANKYEPYKDLMLLQIKGRRYVQTRLVEPTPASINSGDCFVLVAKDKVFAWIGEFCNVIEKSKALEVAQLVQQKRDLGCKSVMEPYVVSEVKQATPAGRKFWTALGGVQSYDESGPPEEDEIYEVYMSETNKVYRIDVEEECLEPMSDMWGCVPTHKLLDSKQIIVFDFGTEMYVWTGKHVPFDQRKKGVSLARAMWDRGYDYDESDINPLSPFKGQEDEGLPSKDTSRPDWALFGKISENMETILFKEKFIDWPDDSRLIKVKSRKEEEQENKGEVELKPYDAKLMVPLNTNPVSLELEGSQVGRGAKWVENKDGLRREWEIMTLNVAVWHVMEYEHLKLDTSSYGQFHEGDTYVVRWQYMVVQSGVRNLKGEISKVRNAKTGRERCAYFFWQGIHSSINEKGASALMTVELDEERGPQVRVLEGKEPPCFLNLFKHRMIVHIGKREEEETNTQGPYRLYILRNELESEAYLQEIPCRTSNLRSQTSFILLNVKTGSLLVWHGAKSAQHIRQRVLELAKSIETRRPMELDVHKEATVVITELREGAERSDFWAAFDKEDRSLYNSLLRDSRPWTHTPRMFYMNSVSGVFEAIEVLNPARNHEVSSPFPFLQSQLYSATQPALFLCDIEDKVYLWQGWWPEGNEEVENVNTGSAFARFNIDRKCALETTLAYCREKNSSSPPPAYLIYGGLEPMEFTNCFPLWEVNDQVQEINTKEGKHHGQLVPVAELLVKLQRTKYTWEELQERPLPEGVDPLKMEAYLVDEEFEEILSMNREEFYQLQPWKQGKLKQEVGLF